MGQISKTTNTATGSNLPFLSTLDFVGLQMAWLPKSELLHFQVFGPFLIVGLPGKVTLSHAMVRGEPLGFHLPFGTQPARYLVRGKGP